MSWAELDGSGTSFKWTTSGYIKELVDEFKATIPPSGRTWTPGYRTGYRSREPGYWDVAAQYWDTVISLCQKHGLTVQTYGSVQAASARVYTIRLDYMGLVRPRDGGIYTATGWVDNGWNAVFPLEILQDWFKFTLSPGDMPTLYSVLGVDQNLDGLAFDKALKKAYRSAARTYHPDVNKEPDAAENFRAVQEAYEKLQDPVFRKRYKAGLHFQKKVERGSTVYGSEALNWKPPIRCGILEIDAIHAMSKYDIKKIVTWKDIMNTAGETLVTYWKPGDSFFREKWVQ